MKKIKYILKCKFLSYFVKDFHKYLSHMEYYYSDEFYCLNADNFDNLDEFLFYSDKYIKEINIVRSWVTDYECYCKIKE